MEQFWSPQKAEQLDRDHIRAAFQAAKRSKRKPNLVFVKQIAELRQQKIILLRLITKFATGISIEHSLNQMTQQESTYCLPSTKEACQELLRDVKKQIKQLEKQAVPLWRKELKRQLLQ